ncbi:MAG: endonuclease/exonuclease/phosphatase family protein [Planctomycetes bacterium]|nr:endonuclease/exonuclease/phosphatase family protein [Planctomycetota bacterium]
MLRTRLLPLLGAVALLALAGCRSTPHAVEHLRVAVWNIHHARGLDGRVDVARIADELRAHAPDFVLLQEVDVGVARTGRVDIPAELARSLRMHAAFAENIPYQGGSYGNAILSRWPITARHNRHYRMLREGEQRGLISVVVDAPGGPLAIGCTHLEANRDDAERLQNAPEILDEIARRDLLAVGGDFNDLPDSPLHAALCGPLVDCWREVSGATGGGTFPAKRPDKRIDWLLRPAGAWRTVAARVVSTAASDHSPVVFELVRR